EFRRDAEMPFADQGRAVARFPEERRQSRMLRRQSNTGFCDRQRFLETDAEAILIAPGDQRGPGGRTDRRIRIGLEQAHTVRGDAVDVGRFEVWTAVARDIGVAQIVREDEDDVGTRRSLRPEIWRV